MLGAALLHGRQIIAAQFVSDGANSLFVIAYHRSAFRDHSRHAFDTPILRTPTPTVKECHAHSQ
jgi:lipopolysaccharide export system protein LptC